MYFVLFFALASAWAIEPTGYDKKAELKAQAEVVGSRILFNYGFKDLNGTYQEWSWEDDYDRLRSLSQQFGMTVKNPGSLSFSESEIAPGNFQKHPLVGLIPDYSKLISLYQSTVSAIYGNWSRTVLAQKLSRRESVELLLRFLQDYPYGIPPSVIGRKYVAGLLVPPLSLETGWADCDSKSLLLATVLSYDSYFKDKMAMILVPGHALLGIEMPVIPYDETYEYRNRTFVVAEPTGLSRTPFGRRNSPYSRLLAIIPLTGPENSAPAQRSSVALTESDCPDEGLLVEYFPAPEKNKVQVCMLKIGNDFIKHGPLLKYDASGQIREKEFYHRGERKQ